MPQKKNFHIALDPAVHRRLRVKAAEFAVPAGDVIEGLLNFADSILALDEPEVTKSTIHAIFVSTMDSGSEGEIVPDGDVNAYLAKLKGQKTE